MPRAAHEPRPERKLAAILTADVVGYSRLMGLDEAGTLRCMKTLRRELINPRIADHRGRVVKTTGDGILIEFPSVVEAVQCAVEVQRAMMHRNADVLPETRIEFRVGINLGDVIVEDGDIYGDGVNVAARLEALAEPGGICVSRTVRDHVRDRLPYAFEDRGEHQVKNIARLVRVFALSSAAIAAQPSSESPTSSQVARTPRLGRAWVAATGAALLVIGTAGAWWWSQRAPEPPVPTPATIAPAPAPVASPVSTTSPTTPVPRLSIVVLPFANMSNNPEQDYFADGVTEDLTTELSRFSGLFVISRNTAFTYKGKAVDLKQVGRDLGVRYVLEGSVRRLGDEVRINAQLIDTDTGGHLWAERFNGTRAALASLNDDIVHRIAQALWHEMTVAEGRRAERKAPHEVDAEDLAMRGWSVYLRGRTTRESLTEAIPYFEEAVRRDPRSTRGWRGLSFAHTLLFVRGAIDRDTARHVADEAAARTHAVAPSDYFTLYAQQHKHYLNYDWPEWLRGAEELIAFYPSEAEAYGDKGTALLYLGRPEETFAWIDEAIHLSPCDPRLGTWYHVRAFAHFQLARYEDAARWFRRALDINPDFFRARVLLPAALALAGREAEARTAFAELTARYPGLTVQRVRAQSGVSANPRFVEATERYLTALRELGLAEG